ncbi:MAG TPA: hypothetical protein VK489_15240, partial [Ferruginibacter sp.]|nr:hypothetical protein [Ferruginibacter sp.]
QDFEKEIPLEVKAEQKKIPFTRNGKNISIDIRLQMGSYWLKLMKNKGLDYSKEFTTNYKFELPPNDRTTDHIYAHKEVWQQYAAISGRSLDGYQLYQHIIVPGNNASDGIVNTDPDKTTLDNLGLQFKEWFAGIYYQPDDEKNNAWLPDRLEYQFDCSATDSIKNKTLKAEEYYQGQMDWYVFDIEENGRNGNGQPGNISTDTNTFIPSHVEFDGMPNTCWWKFEDGKTNLGDIQPSTTDLSKLLLMEFGLVFANDWFLVPYTLPIGSLANIEGLTVKNNFGETTWIKAAEESGSSNNAWSMFKLHATEQNNTLFLAPSAMKVHEGKPLEEIVLIRDEISNMVWGIETTIPLPLGKGDKGNEVALRTRQFHEKTVNQAPASVTVPYAAKINYLAMTDVPENWIPFVPVHIKNDTREIQLQRASMLRIIQGDTLDPVKVKPQTSILREGLEEIPKPLPYYIHEQEIPRSGVRVTQSFQRTRWINGEVFVWLGMQKKTGRGEGSSGLQFDKIADVKE